ncbi:DNA polymerase [Streptomyces sp. NEAU-Y11]|uniref:DNA polymerase n=1 Tax=Streptomyces cucumeris TaxID=2962890 RepID=UPI0020C8FB97|nr:DNA polymerase [Streptomyces sp. NEAU-Y11]MCP9209707.1 DNA polymerase [Streptomyces sp. NEAU-Y11]
MPTGGIVGFDLETADAELLFKGGHEGPFCRLFGWIVDDGEPQISTDAADLLRVLDEARIIYGHNILDFDLLALAWHHGANYRRLARKSIDTLVGERTLNPPYPKAKPGTPLNLAALRKRGLKPADLRISYRLDDVASRYGLPGKTDDLAVIAAQYGGHDKIPLDNRQYREYLCGDLRAGRAAYREMGRRAQAKGLLGVARREMFIAGVQSGMHLKGLGVDEVEVDAQIELTERQRAEAYTLLHERAGVPLPHSGIRWAEKVQVKVPRTTPHGKMIRRRYAAIFDHACPDVRQGVKWHTKTIGTSPLTTTEGRTAFEAALRSAGVADKDIPFTEGGTLALSKHALGEGSWLRGKVSIPGLLQKYPASPAIRELCEAAILITSASAKAEEVKKAICPDGRVHARIGEIQASGRWAHIKPSITNIGKRGKAQLQQRAMFKAKAGHVFIAIDLDQVDARAIAGHCQDREYMNLARPGMDMHYEVALRVYGAGSCEDCRDCRDCEERRSNTKATTHAWNYGQGPQGASVATGLPIEITKKFDEGMQEAFPVLCRWRGRIRQHAKQTGMVPSKWGRPLRVIPGQEYTQAPAQVGQSTTRDLMCDGLLRMDEELLDMLCLVIHDEIVLEVPEERVEEIGKKAVAALTTTFGGVPITCGVSPASRSWIGCYEK